METRARFKVSSEKTGVLEIMAAAFQLVLEAEEDADLPVSYMKKLI